MAHALSQAAKHDALDAALDTLDGGYLRIYTGSRRASPDAPVGGATLLAELALGSPAFAAASGGSKSVNPITEDNAANASGTAGWYTLVKSDGTTAVVDGDVTSTPGPGNLVLPTTTITAGITVQVTSLSYNIG